MERAPVAIPMRKVKTPPSLAGTRSGAGPTRGCSSVKILAATIRARADGSTARARAATKAPQYPRISALHVRPTPCYQAPLPRNILWVIWLVGGALCVLTIVLGINTYRSGPPPPPASLRDGAAAPKLDIDADAAAKRLAASVQFRTRSHSSEGPTEQAAFRELHDYLAAHYPNAHGALKREVVNGSILLFTWPGKDPSPVSDSDSESFARLRRTILDVFPDVTFAPSLVIAGTDSRHYEKLTDNSYRFMPMRVRREDLSRLHGTNERIAIDNYAEIIRFYAALVKNTTQ